MGVVSMISAAVNENRRIENIVAEKYLSRKISLQVLPPPCLYPPRPEERDSD
jgi:hypothetical protein